MHKTDRASSCAKRAGRVCLKTGRYYGGTQNRPQMKGSVLARPPTTGPVFSCSSPATSQAALTFHVIRASDWRLPACREHDAVLSAIQNVTLDDNTINGAPAGDQAIAIAKNPRGATAASSPRLRVWQWPGGPFTMTSAEVDETETLIMTVGRPELRDIQEVRSTMPSHD